MTTPTPQAASTPHGGPAETPPRPTSRRAVLHAACIGAAGWAMGSPAHGAADAPAQVMLLGMFHFDNPGLDAVKYRPLDVMQPPVQAYLVELSQRLARLAPTRVLLEYPPARDAVMNQRLADHRAGRYELPRNEIYQLGFRIAQAAGLERVHGMDIDMPKAETPLWGYLDQVPQTRDKLMALIAQESRRLEALHRERSLREILLQTNAPEEDRRNKGFYMLLNDVAAAQGLFHGADASAQWWHRNLRMYAWIQRHAQPGDRTLVIAGSGHVAILRDLLHADAERRALDLRPHL
ncbi:MAG: DUF5694 domain-containing protein [Aquabacterium sp.]